MIGGQNVKKECCISVDGIKGKEQASFFFDAGYYCVSLALNGTLSQVIGWGFALGESREIEIQLQDVNYNAEIVTYIKDESSNLLIIKIRNIMITDNILAVNSLKFDLICCNKKHSYPLPDKIMISNAEITIKSYPKQHKSKFTVKFKKSMENEKVAWQIIEQLRTFFSIVFASEFYESNVIIFANNIKYPYYYISRCKKDSAYFLGNSRITVLDYSFCFEKWMEFWSKYSKIILMLEFLHTSEYQIVDMYYSAIFSVLEAYFEANKDKYNDNISNELVEVIAELRSIVKNSNIPKGNKEDIYNNLEQVGNRSLKNRCYCLLDSLKPQLVAIDLKFNDDTDSLREIFKVLVDTRNYITHRHKAREKTVYLNPNDPKGNFIKSIWFLREFLIISLFNEIDDKCYRLTPAFMKSVTNWHLETIHEYIQSQKKL